MNKIEVFECHECGTISKEESDITACISKHEEQRVVDDEVSVYKAYHKKITSYLIDNLTSLKAEEVGIHITSFTKLFGYRLDIASITGGTYMQSINHPESMRPTYNISGKLHPIPDGEFEELKFPKIPNNYRDYLIDLFNKCNKKNIYFSDILRAIKGVETGTGGEGGNFHYGFRLNVVDFPKIHQNLSDLKIINSKSILFEAEQNRLKSEYTKFRKPAVLISDIRYQAIKSEWDEIHLQMEELKLRSLVIGKEMEQRSEYILSKDAPKHITPAPELDFDRELRKKLISELGIQ
jgi:hypothetical protein